MPQWASPRHEALLQQYPKIYPDWPGGVIPSRGSQEVEAPIFPGRVDYEDPVARYEQSQKMMQGIMSLLGGDRW